LRGSSEIRPKICVSIIEGTKEGARSAAKEAENNRADLIEVRLDRIKGLTKKSVAELFIDLSEVRLPKIATIMTKTSFGKFSGSDSERVELLLAAAEYADYVDVGVEMEESLRVSCMERLGDRVKVIISWHSDRPLTKSEVTSFVIAEGKKGISKIAMPARRLQDNLVALDACSALEGYRRIIFCYGEAGKISRAFSPFFGSEWTYASLARGKEAAPGQMDIRSLRAVQEAFVV
jgi:3-dehydroquinate dehydratase-1